MAFAPTVLGPFTGGMNNRQPIDSIDDSQVSLLQNMDVDPDGSLTSRPAIITEWEQTAHVDQIVALGWYISDSQVSSLVCRVGSTTKIYTPSTQTWTQIWDQPASDFVQYDSKIVMSCETHAGAYWDSGALTAMDDMPVAAGIELFQERFWIFGPKGTDDQATVFFSNITAIDPATSIFDWTPAQDFLLVSDGDGQWITSLLATSSGLFIFRNQSTYNFRYPSAPISGTLTLVDPRIGADNQFCVVRYETSYYVLSRGRLYEFTQSRYWPKGMEAISFAPSVVVGGSAVDERLSVFGHRLLIWHYGSLYCYSFETNTWSQWVSATAAAHFLESPDTAPGSDRRTALAVSGSGASTTWNLYRISEQTLATGAGEQFTCMVRTKVYSMQQPLQFKRLAWWAVELRARGELTAAVYPVAVPEYSPVTWLDMEAYGWNDFGTWLNPLVKTAIIEDGVLDASGPSLSRVSVRLGNDVQFMNIYFEISFTADGTTRTSPARLFSTTLYMSLRGTVTKKVT